MRASEARNRDGGYCLTHRWAAYPEDAVQAACPVPRQAATLVMTWEGRPASSPRVPGRHHLGERTTWHTTEQAPGVVRPPRDQAGGRAGTGADAQPASRIDHLDSWCRLLWFGGLSRKRYALVARPTRCEAHCSCRARIEGGLVARLAGNAAIRPDAEAAMADVHSRQRAASACGLARKRRGPDASGCWPDRTGRHAMSSVSAGIPCYSYGHFLADAVRSVLDDQADVDVRVLIIDDASPDSGAEVARQIAAGDPRVEVSVQPAQPRAHRHSVTRACMSGPTVTTPSSMSADDSSRLAPATRCRLA